MYLRHARPAGLVRIINVLLDAPLDSLAVTKQLTEISVNKYTRMKMPAFCLHRQSRPTYTRVLESDRLTRVRRDSDSGLGKTWTLSKCIVCPSRKVLWDFSNCRIIYGRCQFSSKQPPPITLPYNYYESERIFGFLWPAMINARPVEPDTSGVGSWKLQLQAMKSSAVAMNTFIVYYTQRNIIVVCE